MLNHLFIKVGCIVIIVTACFSVAAQKITYKTFDITKYGANPNDDKDDVPAIDSAIKAADAWRNNDPHKMGIIKFPASSAGEYLIKSYTELKNEYLNNYVIKLRSNLVFRGDDRNKCILKVADNMFNQRDEKGNKKNANIFYGKYVSNISFCNLTVDANGINNLTIADDSTREKDRTQALLTVKIEGDSTCSNLLLDNILIKNNPGRNDIGIYGNGKNAIIKNSVFLNGGWNVGSDSIANTANGDFSFIFSEWDNSVFESDSIIQQYPDIALQYYTGGIEIHGNNSAVNNTYIYGCNPALYICSERSKTKIYTLADISVTNTKMLSCVRGIEIWLVNHIDGINIENNYIELTYPRGTRLFSKAYEYSPVGISVARGNMPNYSNYTRTFIYGKDRNANSDSLNDFIVRANEFVSAVPDTSHLFMTVGMRLHSLKNSIIERNIISGMSHAGIQLQASPWGMSDVVFSNNIIKDFKPNYNTKAVAGYFVVTDTYDQSTGPYKAKPVFENITIENNAFYANNNTTAAASACGSAAKQMACFRGLFFALPKWYAYTNNMSPFLMNPSVFSIHDNQLMNNVADEGVYLVEKK